MSEEQKSESKESRVSSNLGNNPHAPFMWPSVTSSVEYSDIQREIEERQNANKAMYENALRVLQENKYSPEEASKLLEQRPNLIVLTNAMYDGSHYDIQSHLQDLKDKNNEQLGKIVSHLEKFSGKKQDHWWIFKNGSKIWQKSFNYTHVYIALYLDSLPQEVSNYIHSHGVLDIRMSRVVMRAIFFYKEKNLTAKQLQELLEPFSYDSLNARIVIMGDVYNLELSDKNFKELVLTLTPEMLLNVHDDIETLRIRERNLEFIKPMVELFCTLEGQNKIFLSKILVFLQDNGKSVKNSLGRFKACPNLIPLAYRANELKMNLLLFLDSVWYRSNDELGVMVSCLERFAKPSKDFFMAVVSINGLNLPEVKTVKAFLDSLPIPADEKLYKQAIDFAQASIEHVDKTLLGPKRLAKFLEPIPKDCKEVSKLIASRESLLVARSWVVSGMFAEIQQSCGEIAELKAITPIKEFSQMISDFFSPIDPKEVTRLYSAVPETLKKPEVAGGDQGQNLDGVRRPGLE